VAVLLTAHQLRHAFGGRPLFEGLTVTVEDGDRIGLIGPNGAGKSTLLAILAGALQPDDGNVARRSGIRIARLAQTPRFTAETTVREAIAAGLDRGSAAGWEGEARVDETVARLELGGSEAPVDAKVARLSGGWQKRVALAQALVGQPDILLLDEPTNHLDIDSILWLERFISSAPFATITITHDRAFLQKIATRIWELDRRNAGGLLAVEGSYLAYLERKEAEMAAQEQREASLRNTLRRETEWLRRGPAARTTKQKARIDRAAALAADVDELGTRNRKGSVQLDFGGTHKKPKRLIEAKGISKSYDRGPLFEGLDLTLTPGTRLGILGRNGCGKSSLLRVLLGQPPSEAALGTEEAIAGAQALRRRGADARSAGPGRLLPPPHRDPPDAGGAALGRQRRQSADRGHP